MTAPAYDTPDWNTTGTQTIRCGRPGVRREQDSRHAAWIRREAKKRGLSCHATLADGVVHVTLKQS